jgi:hypothetical protein
MRRFFQNVSGKIIAESGVEPCPRVGPSAVRGCARHPQYLGDLFDGLSSEEMELNHLRRLGVLFRQAVERPVEGEDFFRERRDRQILVFQVNAPAATSVLVAVFSSGVLDQDAAHGFRRRREEMPAAVPVRFLSGPDQSEIGFMNQRRRLQGLARPLVGQPLGSQPTKFVVDEWQ